VLILAVLVPVPAPVWFDVTVVYGVVVVVVVVLFVLLVY